MTEAGNPPSVAQWVERAEHDLLTIEILLQIAEACPIDIVCFHAQQCAEKYLKALLRHRGSAFAFTHDLIHLLGLLPAADRRLIEALPLEALNAFVIEGRYPGDWDPMPRSDAEAAVALAREVRRVVRALLAGEAP